MGHDNDADEIALSKRRHVWNAKPVATGYGTGDLRPLWLFLAKVVEFVFLYMFLGYGYRIGRALVILFALGCGFALFYPQAFEQGAIVPSDKELRKLAMDCGNWPGTWACRELTGKVVPFNACVIIPVIGLGQKSAWQPAPATSINLPILGWESPTNFVCYMQLFETGVGWVGGLLLVSFVTGLIKKE
jgi:hypothetical protein